MIKMIEKLIEIDDKDIELLYFPIKEFFNNFIEYGFNDWIIDVIRKKDTLILKKFNSKILQSKKCKIAHKENPIDIYIVFSFSIGNGYIPNKKRINISINASLLLYIFNTLTINNKNILKSFNVDNFLKLLPPKEYFKFKNKIKAEFSETASKATIYHELSHWIDDTLHNRYILNFINNISSEKDKNSYLMRKYKSLNIEQSYMEINAQIHSIYQLYREYKSIWNDINLFEMISYSPALITIYERIKKNKDDLILWLRLLITRMNREDILGDNMNYIPNNERYIYEWKQTNYNLYENYGIV